MKQSIPENYLPSPGQCPKLVFPKGMQYAARLNACQELLDRNLSAGRGNRPAILYQGRTISYDELA